MRRGFRNRTETAERVARHRRKLGARGIRRVEVAIPAPDSDLIKQVAAILRAGGEPARKVRETLSPDVRFRQAKSGYELVAFFRSSPLVGEELEFARDRSRGRAIDL